MASMIGAILFKSPPIFWIGKAWVLSLSPTTLQIFWTTHRKLSIAGSTVLLHCPEGRKKNWHVFEPKIRALRDCNKPRELCTAPNQRPSRSLWVFVLIGCSIFRSFRQD